MAPIEKRENWLKSGITIGELLAASLVVAASVLMFWKTTDIRLSALEIRMNEKEKMDQKINEKLDKLQDGVNDVRLTLKDKQDRK